MHDIGKYGLEAWWATTQHFVEYGVNYLFGGRWTN